jgi:N-methylhydantoinase B
MTAEHLDPFTLTIVEAALEAVSEEMFLTLRRTSQSPLIYEVLDFATGLTDAEGRLVVQGHGVTGFLASLSGDVVETIRRLGHLDEGDVVIANDPYRGGGTHLNDVTLLAPLYAAGQRLGYAAAKAHWTELGGAQAGGWSPDTADIYAEGLRFPFVRIARRGVWNEDLVNLLAANVRTPSATVADMTAQRAILEMAGRRVAELAARYGADAVREAMARRLRRDERLARDTLQRLPHGVYEAEDVIDEREGPGLPIRVRVTISAEGMTADFTGSAPVSRESLNGTWPSLVAGVRTAYRSLFPPGSVSDGLFQPLTIVCPPGTVFTAEEPIAVSTYWEASDHATDLVWKALAPVLPERYPAGHSLSVCGYLLALQGDDGLKILVEPQAGGWGGGPGADGESALVPVGDGETFAISAEVMERRFPVEVLEWSLDTDVPPGTGAGAYRGGRGFRRRLRLKAPGLLTAAFGRHRHPPWGLAGGRDGSPNYLRVWDATGGVRLMAGRVARVSLAPGDEVELVTGSGGGYGDPRRRSPAEVARDVRDGLITPEEARDVYGYDESSPLASAGTGDEEDGRCASGST